ncbi:MAG: Mov34/MPN/PAD-1 family protein [Rhodothermaceae bacterium]|nr:MAG: Mov34/MPN/PAD-1 family protein [Rhodothermaceae bacterium]
MLTHTAVLDAIREHGRDTYPEECCGFLLGTFAPEGNRVVAVQRVPNRRAEHRERRYTLAPEDYRHAERAARGLGLDVVGFYHSHPDHPARPSATDLAEATFPGYTYVIVAVRDGVPADLTAWSLAPDRSRFLPEAITVDDEALRAARAEG